jgi:hypothetical protein
MMIYTTLLNIIEKRQIEDYCYSLMCVQYIIIHHGNTSDVATFTRYNVPTLHDRNGNKEALKVKV